MKKLISLGVASTMVATLAAPAFAVKESGKTVLDLQPIYMTGESTTLKSAKIGEIKSNEVHGYNFDSFHLRGSNTDSYKIYFGVSLDGPLFGVGSDSTKPASLQIVKAATGNAIKKSNSGEFTSRGVSVTTGKEKVTTTFGEYGGAYCVKVTFTNKGPNDLYGAFDITLKGADGKEKVFKLTTTASGLDATDTSNADVDTTDEGYREYADGAPLKNDSLISAAELKAMVGKGQYKFAGSNGIDVLSSISQATVNEGRTVYSSTLGIDTNLDSRYNKEGTSKVFKLNVPFLKQENRQINIDCDNQKVIDIIGTDLADKVVNGSLTRLYVYPINESGYNSLAKASGNDGLINTDEVISATVSNSKIAFNLPKGVTNAMISLKELDTNTLPAIPGVSIPEDTSAAVDNEITAPVISDLDTSSATSDNGLIAAPTVDSPVLTSVPATSNAVQNTGASDVIVLAIALAVISMAAAGIVATKKC